MISSVPDLRGLFEKGNKAYLDGDYDTAVSEYRKVLEAGVNHPDLAFNLVFDFAILNNEMVVSL